MYSALLKKNKPIYGKINLQHYLFILCLIVIIITLFQLRIQHPYKILETALETMKSEHDFLKVEIYEKGNDYALNFKGRLLGKNSLSGRLLNYEIEVYLNRYGDLYVKDLVDGTWKNAVDLDLENLKHFLVMPFEVLSIYKKYFSQACFIEKIGEKEQLFKFHIPSESISILLSSANKGDYYLECFLAVDEDSYFIRKVSFILYDQNLQAEILTRTYIFI